MDLTIEGAKDRPCWFVGSSFEGGRDDQTERFIREGIWINGCEEKYTDLVKSVRVGDRIAMKSAYTRKRNLPFDNKNNLISVMGIKAIGTVTENPGDGHNLKVAWTALNPHREWYFSTSRTTIWRVTPGNWKTPSSSSPPTTGRSRKCRPTAAPPSGAARVRPGRAG